MSSSVAVLNRHHGPLRADLERFAGRGEGQREDFSDAERGRIAIRVESVYLVLRRADVLKARPDYVRIRAVRGDSDGNVEESVSFALSEYATHDAVAVRRDAANLRESPRQTNETAARRMDEGGD